MSTYNELEIVLDSLDGLNYRITLKFTQGGGQQGALQQAGPADIQINHEALAADLIEGDLRAYGRRLRDALLTPPQIAAKFAQAANQLPLRIKLSLDPADKALHSPRWELLLGLDDTALSSRHDIAFSRYLPSGVAVDLRREPDDLRALIVVVDPSPEDRDKYGLAEIDVNYARRAAALQPIPCDSLSSADDPVTMNRLIGKLKEGEALYGGYDILYLVCHGAMVRGGARLLLDLETDQEMADPAYFRSGEVLVRRLAEEVPTLPRLVLLASCATAGTGDGNTLAALGPLLATAGVPAVIAMQGYIQIPTIEAFIPVFFEALNAHGQVDRAMRRARSHVKNESNFDDWWMPALFMRLANGRIWYKPSFDVETGEHELWQDITGLIAPIMGFDGERSRCTPILGPGLTRHLFGSDGWLARTWAREHDFPLAPYDRDHFPQVAQYLTVRLKEQQLKLTYWNQLREGLANGFPDVFDGPQLPLNKMIELLWEKRLKNDIEEPHNILARLPFTCYITTNPTPVLETALRCQGRKPRVEIYNWQKKRLQRRPGSDDQPPSFEEPLVFHALGQFDEDKSESLVLSEDDYYHYLINFIRSWENDVSPSVKSALTNSALLFLGFRLFRWDFRMVFYSLLNQGEGGRHDDYPQVAAQLSPTEGAFLNPAAARSYLAEYYRGRNASKFKLDIFWGEAADFLGKLDEEWSKRNGREEA